MKLYRFALLLGIFCAQAQDHYNLVVGTYTNECESNGIYVYDYNPVTAELTLKSEANKVENPSFLTVSPDKKFIYSVNENGGNSTVSAFKYEPASGKIDFINKKDSRGADPCYIINDDKNVIVANYSGGSIAVYGRNADGSLTDVKQVLVLTGSSITERQKSPHIHMVQFSPKKNYVLATDLGTDKIYIYKYDAKGGDKTLVLKETTDLKKGSGPRHLVFNTNSIFAYAIQELDATLTAFSYSKGKLNKLQEINTQPAEFTGENGAADIHITKDGKFIYTTNRGDANMISVYRVHANGKLNMVQQISTMGEGPRNFAIGPLENFVLVANQKSNNIVVFKRDKTTGMLEDTGNRTELCQPVCLVFTENK